MQPSRRAIAGRTLHDGRETLPRHLHSEGFFALVLKGSYVEAGDSGRHRVAAGDVIVHRPFERHLDRFSASGAEVLIVPLPAASNRTVLGRVADPDVIARIAERDSTEARERLVAAMTDVPVAIEDWPDLLARDLLADPSLSLAEWSDRHKLHPAGLARGFRQIFDVSPASFRTMARARRAIDHIFGSPAPLAAIASEEGFADQAHMTRAIGRLTGQSPDRLRRQAHSGHFADLRA